MTVFKLVLRNAGTIDYERKRLYTLDLTVSDGVLEDRAVVIITVLNVNDVTVEDVSVVTTGGTTLLTGGSQKVQITGTNFGILYGTDTALKPELDVTYVYGAARPRGSPVPGRGLAGRVSESPCVAGREGAHTVKWC